MGMRGEWPEVDGAGSKACRPGVVHVYGLGWSGTRTRPTGRRL
jgi:hypothetical protein